MTGVRVAVRRAGAADPELLDFQINGDRPDFAIGTERINEWSVKHADDRLLDLLDIAGAVFAVDGMVLRGGRTRPGLGADWRRELDFDITVRDRDFWRRRDVATALADAVGFLTDDGVSFRFTQADAFTPRQHYLPFSTANRPSLSADHVVLFSGGLDSLTGALETLAHETGRVVLVTHQSAPKIATRQKALADELRRRHPDRVAFVPIRANRRNGKALERTYRSRSFLFASFAYVIARVVGAGRLSFFENGVVSHNLPFSPQIIGTMATRTTHPQALRRFETLFSLIGGPPVAVCNPYEWRTKKEVLDSLRDLGGSDLIKTAVSCNEVLKRSVEKTHCGACSQCLDRRFAVLGAGLVEHEPDDIYETPVISGARETIRSRVMAFEWTRHALRFPDMTPEAFQERFGGDIARIARGFPTLSGGEVLRRSLDLHRRHGAAVRRVLGQALAEESTAIIGRSLPETSLLRVVVADLSGGGSIAPVDEGVLAAALAVEHDPETSDEAAPFVVILRADGRGRLIEVLDLGAVRGSPAHPVFALQPFQAQAKRDGLCMKDHRFVSAKQLSPEGGASASAVTQNVKRCRDQLSEYWEAIHGAPPERDLLIESDPGRRGYRLDPTAVLVDGANRRR